MSYPSKILFHSFVKSFYRENAGFFVFVFTMMFYIVGKVNGAGLFEYHYSLIMGMLKSNTFLALVFFAWFLYVRKYAAFVSNLMRNPRYSFLQIFNCLDKTRRFRLFLVVEAWLLMPVLLYAIFIILAGCYQHLYLPVSLVIGYLLLLCIVAAAWHVCLLNNLHGKEVFLLQKLKKKFRLLSSYQVILIRFVFNKQKMIWTGIKVFTCGMLYLVARNNSPADFDTGTAFLFFDFGILANGVLIYRIREFEDTCLAFYRGAPVSLTKRFLQYALIYFTFLIPEFITACMLVPGHLHYIDAISFSLCGFSLLLLMNSITFLEDFSMREYLKILLLLFCVQYIFLMTIGLTFLYLLFFMLAAIFFLKGYYRFERNS